jgi:hypothetical protein
MKRNAGKLFFKGFIRSFFIVTIILGAGVLSYKATMHFWKTPKEEAVVAYKEQAVEEHITTARVDDVSKNLIYCYDETTNEINKIVLEIFSCKNNRLTYITLPVRSQITISDTLYRDLVLVNPEIPLNHILYPGLDTSLS